MFHREFCVERHDVIEIIAGGAVLAAQVIQQPAAGDFSVRGLMQKNLA